jgi:hypothetical protein
MAPKRLNGSMGHGAFLMQQHRKLPMQDFKHLRNYQGYGLSGRRADVGPRMACMENVTPGGAEAITLS